MKKDGFEVTWEADDGYVGGSRPHHFQIRQDDIDTDLNENQLRSLFWDLVQEDFEQTVSWTSPDEEEFVEWAKGVQKEAEE